MIEAARDARGFPIARCRCDDCGASVDVRAAHDRHDTAIASPAQVHTKLQAKGWRITSRAMLCQDCVPLKPAREPEMTAAPPPRQPTREQKRAIIALLDDVYDTEAGRYRGKETDQSVAAATGADVPFAWVTQLREELYGASGANESADDLIEEIRGWQSKANIEADAMHKLLVDMQGHLRAFNDAKAKVGDLMAQVEQIKRAMGPRAKLVRATTD